MQGSLVAYDGRMVSRDGFRVFMYGKDNKKKLVESWENFQASLKTGDWYASIHEVPALLANDNEHVVSNGAFETLIKSKVKRK